MPRWIPFRRRRTENDFADEIRAHVEHETERLVQNGLSPEDARAAALRSFGSVTRTRERFHDARRVMWLDHAVRDLRYAWRGLRHSRAFAASTVLTLAAGMSLVTVVFTLLNAYVLRPFAVRDPYSLYTIGWQAQEAAGSSFRWRDYELVQERGDLFDGVVASIQGSLVSGGQPLAIGFVSANYFDVLAPQVLLGRSLTAGDARAPGAEPVAVLAHQAWTRLFGADPAVVGSEVELAGRKLVVVGVMGPAFTGLGGTPRDAWIPVTMYDALTGERVFGPGDSRPLQLVGRLRHDVGVEQAQGSLALEPFATRLAGRVDTVRPSLRSSATPMRMTWQEWTALTPIFAAFALVLLAACANASNVMLARANARYREIAIRLSIGASRGRVVRQLMAEGLLIASLAALVGLALASALLRLGTVAFVALLPPTIAGRARFVPLDFDHRVFLFVCIVAAITSVLFALMPALQATRLTLTDALHGQPGSRIRSGTLRNVLVGSQVAVSLLLLVVAATLTRNASAVRATDVGMETDGVISVRPRRGDATLAGRAFDQLTADPRFRDVVATSRNPLFGQPPKIPVGAPEGMVFAAYRFVSPGYFSMFGMPIVHGRGFTEDEARQEAAVAVVSAAGARRLWPGQDPLGQSVRLALEPVGERMVAETVHSLRRVGDEMHTTVVTIVGVTSDVVSGFVYEGVDAAHLYLPTTAAGSRAQALLVRPVPRGGSIDAMRSVLQRAHPDPLAYDVLAVDEMLALQLFPVRAASWIGALLSAVALTLSVSGLYGVLTYTLGQRAQEIGIRLALGATPASVGSLLARQSARLAAYGAVVGGLAAFAVMKILSTMIEMQNVSVVDPGAFGVAIALIAASVVLSSYGPSRRAARLDPSSMLRSEQ